MSFIAVLTLQQTKNGLKKKKKSKKEKKIRNCGGGEGKRKSDECVQCVKAGVSPAGGQKDGRQDALALTREKNNDGKARREVGQIRQ